MSVYFTRSSIGCPSAQSHALPASVCVPVCVALGGVSVAMDADSKTYVLLDWRSVVHCGNLERTTLPVEGVDSLSYRIASYRGT